MVTAPERHYRYTYADYVGIEMHSNTKHEFFDGEIFAMAGGSEDHSALAAEIVRVLGNAATRDRRCRVHTSDLRIYVESANLATYPDASVLCERLQQHEGSPDATALNPSVLVEVTSDSSAEYDEGRKFDYYRTIPSLREYIVVSHRERRITIHRCRGDEWVTESARAGDHITVETLSADLTVDEIYADTTIT